MINSKKTTMNKANEECLMDDDDDRESSCNFYVYQSTHHTKEFRKFCFVPISIINRTDIDFA